MTGGGYRYFVFSISSVLLIPAIAYSDTGWIATTTNYLWPCACGAFSFTLIKRVFAGEKIKWHEFALYVLATLYAANHEQMCALLFGLYSVFFAVFAVKNRKCNAHLLVVLVLVLCSLVFILTTPGNAARTRGSIPIYFPEFNDISIFSKLEIGFSTTMYRVLMRDNAVFFVFTLCLLALSLQNEKLCVRLCGCIPFACCLLFSGAFKISEDILPIVRFCHDALTRFGTQVNPAHIRTLIPDSICALVLFCCAFALFAGGANRNAGIVFALVLLAGFCSRMILSFSPSIHASHERSFIYFYAAIIYCTMNIYNELRLYAETERRKKLFALGETLVWICGFLSLLSFSVADSDVWPLLYDQAHIFTLEQ